MTLQSLVPRFLRPRNSSLSNPDRWLVEAILGSLSTAAGVTVTPLAAMGVSTVYACVNRIAGTVSSIPLKLYKKDGAGGRMEATEHPLYTILHDSPTPEMTSATFRRTMQANLSLRNAAYARILRNGFGEIAELIPIPPSELQLERAVPNAPLVYKVRGAVVPATGILHLKGISLDGVCPLDLVTTARETIGLAIVLQDNAAKFFSNGSRPSVVLEHPGILKKEAAKRLRESFEAHYKGSENAYKVAILEEGMKLVAQRMTATDSQMEESRKRQAQEIAQFFGVPPHKVGILDNATFGNIEEQNIEYVVDCITGILAEWEQTMNMKLLTPEERRDGYFVAFMLEGLLRGAIATRYAAYSVARNWGWLSVNEIRRLENLNPIPGGDAYNTPPNSATTDQPSKPPQSNAK